MAWGSSWRADRARALSLFSVRMRSVYKLACSGSSSSSPHKIITKNRCLIKKISSTSNGWGPSLKAAKKRCRLFNLLWVCEVLAEIFMPSSFQAPSFQHGQTQDLTCQTPQTPAASLFTLSSAKSFRNFLLADDSVAASISPIASGFRPNMSCIYTAFWKAFIGSLDVQKAFDAVRHNSLQWIIMYCTSSCLV